MATRESHTSLDLNTASINLEEVQQGVAQSFREAINDDFDKVEEAINETQEVLNTITKEIWDAPRIVISSSQPSTSTSKTGDVWFKIL